LVFSGNANETNNITLTLQGDNIIEGDENFGVIITSINTSLPVDITDTATVTILEDDSCAAGANAPVIDTSVATVFCDTFNQDLDDYVLSAVPANAVLRWSLSNTNLENSTTHLSSSVVNSPDTYFGFFFDATNSCASPALQIDLTANTTPSPGTVSNAAACSIAGNGPSNIDLDDQLTGADAGVWSFVGGPGGSSITINGANRVNFVGQPDGNYIFRYTTTGAIAPCANQIQELTITVSECILPCDAGNTAPTLDTSQPVDFCDVIDADLDDYVTNTAPAGSELTWSTNPDPLQISAHRSSIINAPGTYYGFFFDEINNCASPTLAIPITINISPSIATSVGGTRCGEGTVVLTATSDQAGAILNWYDVPTGGAILGTGNTFVTPIIASTTSFFVEATSNGCTSSPRVEVVAIVNDQPSAGAVTNTTVCDSSVNGGTTTVDLDDTLNGQDPGNWIFISSTTGDTPVIDADNLVDFEGLQRGDYIFTYTTNTAASPCTNESIDLTITVIECDVDTDEDGLTDDEEMALGTDPNNPDTDGDGLTDGEEVLVIDDSSTDAVPENPSNPLDPCDPFLTIDCNPVPIDLLVEKIVDNDSPILGDNITFTITVSNLTPDRVIDITISDVLEAGFVYVSDIASVGTYDQITGLWSIDELVGDEVATLDITVTIVNSGILVNTAMLTGSLPLDNNIDNDIDEVSVTVIDGVGPCGNCGTICNIFSPNGDGANDFLILNCANLFSGNSLRIFDRYGNDVYEAAPYNNSWDGTFKNGNLPRGTYFYILDLGDGSEVSKGWIQIIR